jgi:methionyl aminopeptidase
MITLKSAADIAAIERAGIILGNLLREVQSHVKPGVSTGDLDDFAEEFITSHEGARAAFKGLYGFPRSVCISVNQEVVHGIPNPSRVLQDGDIVSFDAGVLLDGWYADAAVTVAVGDVDPETRRLIDVTRESLAAGIAQARPGAHMGDIGAAVQKVAESAGFTVVRDLVGHGIGREPHEDPQVPNFGPPGRGVVLKEGMVLAIEPMVNAGKHRVHTLPDKWTVVTTDGRKSAHFEHTVAIEADGARVLTAGNGAGSRSGPARP